jgi:hypothetical protein
MAGNEAFVMASVIRSGWLTVSLRALVSVTAVVASPGWSAPVHAAGAGSSSAAPPPAELLCGVPATATIAPGGQQDVYTFVGATGDQVYVTLLRTGGDAGFTPGVTVYDPAGNPVLDTATASGLEPLLTLGATGTYVVQVHDWAATTNTGTYQLGLEWLTPVAKRCALGTTLGCGAPQTRTLAGVGRHDLHTFVAEAGDRVGVTVIKAEHLDELRAAVSDVYVAVGHTPPAWSTGTVTPRATVIAAAPIEEIRAAVKGIW